MLTKMDAKIDSNQQKMEARIEANNETFEVLRGILVFRMNIHQNRTISTQEDMKAKMEAAMHTIRSELEETIKHSVEVVLSCVDRKMHGLRKELTEKIDETLVDLQAVKAFIDTWIGRLKGDITDTKTDFHKATENTRDDLHEELDSMFRVEAEIIHAEISIKKEIMEAKIEATLHEYQALLKEVGVVAGRGRGTETGTGSAKPPKFDLTISRVVFRRPFETVAEHNCWTRQEKCTYLITAFHGRSTDVLHGVLKEAIYVETLQALEDRFRDQHLPVAYRSQLKTKTLGVRGIHARI
jgi:hypothetical protein